MPIYEFKCSSCEAVFEQLRPLGDTGEGLVCPDCGAPCPEKVFSSFAASSGSSSGDMPACPSAPTCGGPTGFG